jgi:hypothetical protein
MTACWRFSNDFSVSKTGLPSGVQRTSELAMTSRLKKRNRVAIFGRIPRVFAAMEGNRFDGDWRLRGVLLLIVGFARDCRMKKQMKMMKEKKT